MDSLAPDFESTKKKKWPLWPKILLVLVVIAAAGGVGVIVRSWQQPGAEETPAFYEQTNQANKLMQLGKYDEAHKVVDDVLVNPQIKQDDKHSFLVLKAVIYENQKDNTNALENYLSAESIKETSAVAEGIGRTSAAIGNNEQAITYYKKAITLLPTGEPFREELVAYLQSEIVRLGGQP